MIGTSPRSLARWRKNVQNQAMNNYKGKKIKKCSRDNEIRNKKKVRKVAAYPNFFPNTTHR